MTTARLRHLITRTTNWLALLIPLLILPACSSSDEVGENADTMNPIAERYVKLVLRMGQHDNGYVDYYYGPDEWAKGAEAAPGALSDVRVEAMNLLDELESSVPGFQSDDMTRLRHKYLTRQLQAVVARIDLIGGRVMSFDDESQALYDATAPTNGEAYFQAIVDEVSAALPPGDGPLHERYTKFRESFIIPPESLDAVFSASIDECKERTAQHMELPANESFTVEYVTDKPWSGYNWYQGGNRSLIQVNTELPIYIDRAVDLACHEGYPGHHIYNAMLESQLTQKRGWVEFSVYALFSPQSLIAEGSANYGIDMAFPGKERQEFERDVLFSIAGLDASRVEEYYKVQELTAKLSYAGNEAARAYLDGNIDADEAAAWLNRYALSSPERAAQRVRFIDTYRSYVINYNLGKDLVKKYVERAAGENPTDEQRWAVFGELLSSPRLPSSLQ